MRQPRPLVATAPQLSRCNITGLMGRDVDLVWLVAAQDGQLQVLIGGGRRGGAPHAYLDFSKVGAQPGRR
jgi:hypothetical protein